MSFFNYYFSIQDKCKNLYIYINIDIDYSGVEQTTITVPNIMIFDRWTQFVVVFFSFIRILKFTFFSLFTDLKRIVKNKCPKSKKALHSILNINMYAKLGMKHSNYRNKMSFSIIWIWSELIDYSWIAIHFRTADIDCFFFHVANHHNFTTPNRNSSLHHLIHY